jgi:type IV pilus assembly protein PilB
MCPDSRPDAGKKVLVLRGRKALESYLSSYPSNRAITTGMALLDADAWKRETPDADEAAWSIASQWDMPILPILDFEPDPDAMSQLTSDAVHKLRAIPLIVHNRLIAVALENAGDGKVIEELNFLTAHRVVPVVASAQVIRDGIARHYDRIEDASIAVELGLDLKADSAETTEREAQRLAEEQPVVRLVANMITEAVKRRASDIHLRPGEQGTEILYRIDGEMVPVRRLMHALQPAVVARVKVIAGMNLAEHRRPQDGRTTFTVDDGRKVDMRVSVLPAVHGESVVLRLLDTSEGLFSIDQLGLTPADRVRFDDVMGRSFGMFLTTGPTGSGKSTTLYAMLQELRKQRINILTIEDPVERHVDSVQQMQVNRAVDFTFASALRNFLRHDPDVIMVGEIRDHETANIAVESALTGHLLLSTLHTNTAATTVTRLLDLGVESFLLRASLLAIMAQRLVRLTCKHCKELETVDPHVREALGVGPEEVFHTGRGCSHCDGLGMHGRRAVYELMVVTPAIRRLIVSGAEADKLHRLAIEEGMTPLTQAAVALAREGHISLTEAWRERAD